FHLPKSTLLILIHAFAGRKLIMKAYKEAIKKEYGFYSYGDVMFLLTSLNVVCNTLATEGNGKI
ncbi:S-adenosylmethionine:tRNA ribosyltransferase-isomerase, partial [bacterium]|nr:S-adenosylmethionine:tRNA ribosyltransferase-isomerase [bacterium]